ncbi:MAG: aryl-sulfate sulfotransferase [Bacteroidota bacterium]
MLLFSCSDDNDEPSLDASLSLTNGPVVTVNPSGVAPLTAEIIFSTNINVSVKIRVVGKNDEAADVIHTFPSANDFELPVLGLYANYDNQVELTFLGVQEQDLGTLLFTIRMLPLVDHMPEIEINTINAEEIKSGFNFVNCFGHNDDFNPQRPFMFDQFGDIRWYLDYSDHPLLSELFYDNGMGRLENGNLFFGDGSTNAIYEITMLGEIVNSWRLQGFGFHHHDIEKPNGNFLVT